MKKEIKDANNNITYCESSSGAWYRRVHNKNTGLIYKLFSDGRWYKYTPMHTLHEKGKLNLNLPQVSIII